MRLIRQHTIQAADAPQDALHAWVAQGAGSIKALLPEISTKAYEKVITMKEVKSGCYNYSATRVCQVCGCHDDSCGCETVEDEVRKDD